MGYLNFKAQRETASKEAALRRCWRSRWRSLGRPAVGRNEGILWASSTFNDLFWRVQVIKYLSSLESVPGGHEQPRNGSIACCCEDQLVQLVHVFAADCR